MFLQARKRGAAGEAVRFCVCGVLDIGVRSLRKELHE